MHTQAEWPLSNGPLILAAGLQGGSTGGNLCRRHSRLPLHTLSEWAWMMVGVGSGLAGLSTDDSVSFL